MSRHLEYRELEPLEQRVALMRVAGLSERDIGRFLDCDYTTVAAMVKRPRVARYILALTSTVARDITPAVQDLSAAIEDSAARAFEIEKDVMERLYDTEAEHKNYIRAMLGAAATAQDILDRAGKRAPTRVDHTHSVDQDAVNRIADVLREDSRIERAIDVTPVDVVRS